MAFASHRSAEISRKDARHLLTLPAVSILDPMLPSPLIKAWACLPYPLCSGPAPAGHSADLVGTRES